MTRVEQRLAAANVAVALVALFGGVVTGLFQALEYAGVEVYPSLAPAIRSYYHSLSIHGVLSLREGSAARPVSSHTAGDAEGVVGAGPLLHDRRFPDGTR